MPVVCHVSDRSFFRHQDCPPLSCTSSPLKPAWETRLALANLLWLSLVTGNSTLLKEPSSPFAGEERERWNWNWSACLRRCNWP
jgi:hypothetical protein